MGAGNTLKTEVKEWAGLGVIIVIVSLILLKIKINNPGNMTCDSGWNFSEATNICYNGTGAQSANVTINTLGQTVDTFVTAFSEPKNWAIIVIIAVIGIALFKMFQNKKQGM